MVNITSYVTGSYANILLAVLYIYLCSTGNLSVTGLLTSSVNVCIKNDDHLFNNETCRVKTHTQVNVFHGGKTYHYIFRQKDDPSKGLYVIVETKNTAVLYGLEYTISVPYMYKEHTVSKARNEIEGFCYQSCSQVTHEKCATTTDVPEKLRDSFEVATCCICGINANPYSPRGEYYCDAFNAFFKVRTCMTMSCLEVVGPWYNLYKPTYPPIQDREVQINVYKFDGAQNTIPNLKKKYDKKVKDGHIEVLLHSTERAHKEEYLDFSVKTISSIAKDATPPPLLDKYIAVPFYPRSHETVKGSSLLDRCNDSTWDNSKIKCPKGFNEDECYYYKCALNIRMVSYDAVDPTGTTCDKIGLSTSVWQESDRLCNSPRGSCINNQLGWYLTEHESESYLPTLYGVRPILETVTIDETFVEDQSSPTTHWEDDRHLNYIAYVHPAEDMTTLEFETFEADITTIISKSPGFIVGANIDGICELGTSKKCLANVTIKNTGTRRSSYTVTLKCYYKDDISLTNIVAGSDERTVELKYNKSTMLNMPMDLRIDSVSKPIVCNTTLYSADRTMLDAVKFEIKAKLPEIHGGRDPVSHRARVHAEEDGVIIIPSRDTKVEEEHECDCSIYNIFCIIINFGGCFRYVFRKTYIYIVITLSIILFIILLPIILPLISRIFAGLWWLCLLPYRMAKRIKERSKRNQTDCSEYSSTTTV